MTRSTTTITADYSLRPSALADALARLVEARQPVIVWGPPGCAKSQIAQQVAAASHRTYLDVRALLLDPVDLRGIPWRDADGRTRWAPPAFLPPGDAAGRWLVNLEELPSAVPMVQAALYQLVLDRRCGEYVLPEGAAHVHARETVAHGRVPVMRPVWAGRAGGSNPSPNQEDSSSPPSVVSHGPHSRYAIRPVRSARADRRSERRTEQLRGRCAPYRDDPQGTRTAPCRSSER